MTLFPAGGYLLEIARKGKWAGSELNTRHRDFQSLALPTELPARPKREAPWLSDGLGGVKASDARSILRSALSAEQGAARAFPRRNWIVETRSARLTAARTRQVLLKAFRTESVATTFFGTVFGDTAVGFQLECQ